MLTWQIDDVYIEQILVLHLIMDANSAYHQLKYHFSVICVCVQSQC